MLALPPPPPATLSSSRAGNVSLWRSAGWRSEDGGISWEKRSQGIFFFSFCCFLCLQPGSPRQPPKPPLHYHHPTPNLKFSALLLLKMLLQAADCCVCSLRSVQRNLRVQPAQPEESNPDPGHGLLSQPGVRFH